MVDQFDRAQELDAYFRDQALQAIQKKKGQATLTSSHCQDCGTEIPEGRRQAAPGCSRCVDCQERWEKQHR